MKRTILTTLKITEIEPFDQTYIKVFKSGKYNLMDKDGKLVTETWFDEIHHNVDNTISTKVNDNAVVYKTMDDVASRSKYDAVITNLDAVLKVVNIADIIILDTPIVIGSGKKKQNIVARAVLFGKTVYITADGKILNADYTLYTADDVCIGQVDNERLHEAILDLNVILNSAFVKSNDKTENSMTAVHDYHISIYGISNYKSDEYFLFGETAQRKIYGTANNSDCVGIIKIALYKPCFTKLDNFTIAKELASKFDCKSDNDSERPFFYFKNVEEAMNYIMAVKKAIK